MTDENADSVPEFDMDAAVGQIADGLGFDQPDEPETPDQPPEQETAPEQEPPPVAELKPDEKPDEKPPEARQPPKSWAKDKHELWSKLPPEAQDYYEHREKQMLDGIEQYKGDAGYGKQMRDALLPYKAIIDAQGISEPQAVQYLLNAHYRLTQGSPEQRKSAYEQLGRNLGLIAADPANPDQKVDPMVQQLQEKLNGIESALTASQQAEYQQAQQRTVAEVNQFASDAAHPYFDEVADDIAIYIKSGASLKDAYERAVWANPVTRAKEQGRLQTEAEAKLREKAKTDAEAARKATAANMRGRDTRRPPTEAKGSMDDTLRETMSKIRDRAH